MGFRSVIKIMNLCDLERPNGHHCTLFHAKWQLS